MTGPKYQDPRLDAALETLAASGYLADDEEGSGERLREAQAVIASDQGVLTRVRSLSTPVRTLLAGFVVGALGAVVLLFHARVGLEHYPADRLFLEGVSITSLSLLLSAFALGGPHRPTPKPWVTWSLLGGALLTPLMLAFLPPVDLMLPGAKGGGGGFGREAFVCSVYGLGASFPMVAVLALLRRVPTTDGRLAVLGAGAAGLAGVLALQLHCPIGLRSHLLLGHAVVPLLLIVILLLVHRTFGGFRS